MKLRRRQKPKKAQALDVVASAVKGVSEMHLAKRAGKGVGEGAKKAKGLKGVVQSTPAKIAGAVALVGGVGAVVAKKLKGGDPEPIYTPPAPAEPMAVAPEPEIAAVEESAAAAAAEPELAPPAPELAVAPEPDAPVAMETLDAPADELPASDVPQADTAGGSEALDDLPAEPAVSDAPQAEPIIEAPPELPSEETPFDPAAAATEPPGEGAEEPVTNDDKPAAGTESWRT